MRNSVLLLACAPLLAVSLLAQNLSLPAPRGDEVAITRILAARHDTTEFSTDGIPRQDLSDILWASTGINRPTYTSGVLTNGGRTSNYSYASRDNDIYVLCAEGVFVYDQVGHALTQQSATDLRATLPAPANTAPVSIALVTRAGDVNFFGAIHTGFISENIALVCADRGIGSHIASTIPAGLSAALGLVSGQNLLVLESIGFATGQVGTTPAWTISAGPLVPAAVSTAPALKILKRRRSTRSLAATAFSDQALAELLWAGVGINSTGHTSPQTTGADAIDIYVARATGVYRYHPAAGAEATLESVSTSDIRGSYGYASAPAIFIFVADYAKLTGTTAEKRRAACLQAGHISQNIAVYAAAEGLGELVRSSVANLGGLITLTADQTPLFTQTLGYPATAIGRSTVSFAAGTGGTISGTSSQSIAFGTDATAATAEPAAGYYFSHWSGAVGGRSTANPLQLTDVTTAMTVTANFVTEPLTYASWASGSFSTAELADDSIAGAAADPDHSGLTNLERYAHGLTARGNVSSPVDVSTATVGEERFLTLTFTRRTSATDLAYIVEASGDLVTWSPLATYRSGTPAEVTARDAVAIDSANPPRRFLRLRVSAE